MIRDTQWFVNGIRNLTNMENDPIVSDPEIADRASDAKAALYDLMIGTYEHYAVKPFAFTLVGGIGANSVPLPTDFYKDVSLDFMIGTRPVTVHRFSSWVDRNSIPQRQYIVMGSDLIVNPPQVSAGNYKLTYTPLDMPFAFPVTITTTYPTIPKTPTPGTDAVDTSLSLANWFFAAGTFSAPDVGKMLGIAGAANPGNNGLHLIQAFTDGTDVSTSKVGLSDENFSPDVTANIYTGPFDDVTPSGNPTWDLNSVTFGVNLNIGDKFTVAGSSTSDGTYTILSVLDAHSVQTVEAVGAAETFLPGVTITYQPTGTINILPQIFAPWYEFILVHAAIAVKDKIEQDTSDLEMRLARLTQRVTAMAANRMEEGGQIAMPRGESWLDDVLPWR